MKRSTRASSIFLTATGLIVFALILTMPTPGTIAAPGEQDRIAEFEVRVSRLEERVQKMEQLLREMSGWRVRENWLRIRNGMSFDQVTLILGTPTGTSMTSQNQGTWHYEGVLDEAGPTVSGNVFFTGGRVSLVRPPL